MADLCFLRLELCSSIEDGALVTSRGRITEQEKDLRRLRKQGLTCDVVRSFDES